MIEHRLDFQGRTHLFSLIVASISLDYLRLNPPSRRCDISFKTHSADQMLQGDVSTLVGAHLRGNLHSIAILDVGTIQFAEMQVVNVEAPQ